jgi:hypothetical protein
MKLDRIEMRVLKDAHHEGGMGEDAVTITFRIIGKCFNKVGKPYDFLTSLTD